MVDLADVDDSGAKTTVQSTAAAKSVCERLQKDGYFEDAQRAFRFAVCFALANDLDDVDDSPSGEGGKGFTWSVTGLDPNQILKFLVTEFSSGDRPITQREQYRRIEALGNLGLRVIGDRLDSGVFISELIN